jgi:hypothetical protein
MVSWGKTPEEDFAFSPMGPFLADVEVTTRCGGLPGRGPCSFCYKSNLPEGRNMPLALFKAVLDLFPPTLTQVALGADATCEANPDIWDMMDYCRGKGIIPNITVAALSEEIAARLAERVGACAVSHYGDFALLADSICRLRRHSARPGAALRQIVIHQLLAEENLVEAHHLLERFHDLPRGAVYAVVFLSLKQRGRGKSLTPLSREAFTGIVQAALDREVPMGFDSCSAPKVVRAYKALGRPAPLALIAACESTCESLYCNVEGRFYPCSFSEDGPGIPMAGVLDFYRDVWFHRNTVAFRHDVLGRLDENGIRRCPVYEI